MAITLDVSVSISSICVCVCVPAGEFGVVYRAHLTGWRNTGQELVAVKTLKGMIIYYIYTERCTYKLYSYTDIPAGQIWSHNANTDVLH